jgi:hypothetical protein
VWVWVWVWVWVLSYNGVDRNVEMCPECDIDRNVFARIGEKKKPSVAQIT